MKRRDALKNIGFGFGAVGLAPSAVSLLQSCQSATNNSYQPIFFVDGKFEILSSIMEIIIPETDIPGAKELKLPEFVDAFVDAVVEPDNKQEILDGFNQFIEGALSQSAKKSSEDLKESDLEAELSKHLGVESSVTLAQNPDNELPLATVFAQQLRSLTVAAFRNNEFIGEEVLYYDPVPGRQEGCVDVQTATGGRAYSL